jgi:hypothetical protein
MADSDSDGQQTDDWVAFTGGLRRGPMLVTFPFGKLIVSRDHLEIVDSVDSLRFDRSDVLKMFFEHHYYGTYLVIETINGEVPEPQFGAVGWPAVVETLLRLGWPILPPPPSMWPTA